MLVASPLRSLNNGTEEEEGPDFSMGNWLDSIDFQFDDLLLGSDLETELRNFDDFSEGLPVELDDGSGKINETVSSPEKICRKEVLKGRKASRNNLTGKKKAKVDWTPELHRRFVQAVERLGLDKAVPSRILELMGNDCLTRHNVASHLQKYRSRRKHMLAREAEAAAGNQRYSGVVKKANNVNAWITPTPTIGIPTVVPNFRPVNLNVWGHPSVDQSYINMWHKQYWIPQHHVPSPAYFPPAMSFPGIPPPPHPGLSMRQPPSDIHPSKESVDAAIGEALSKPWMPLPLGLKPPSVDSVVVELQRQGISNIPPSGW